MQTFFIPETIRRMRLFDLKPSPELSSALRKMRIDTFGDLSGVDFREFERVSRIGAALFLEVGELIRQARQGNFAAPSLARPERHAGSIARAVSLRSMPVPTTLPTPQKVAHSDLVSANPKALPAETIFIPQEARGGHSPPSGSPCNCNTSSERKAFA